MDIQVILIFILALLTINLLVVGVYAVLVLKELRETVKRANKVLSVLKGAEFLNKFLENPVERIAGVAKAAVKGYEAIHEAADSIRSIRNDEK